MHAALIDSDRDIAAAIALLETIAAEEGWRPGDGISAYAAASTYFGVWADCGRELVGGLQMVMPEAGTGSLPSDTVWPELAADSRTCRHSAHIAILAVRADWRGRLGNVFCRLEVLLWRHCVLTGIRELSLEATPSTLACYRRFGWPLTVRGDLRDHWGEPCLPCGVSVREVGGAIAEKAARSLSYLDVFDGTVRAQPK